METIATVTKNLTTMIKAKIPVIGMETYEELRAIDLIQSIAERTNRKVFVWSYTEGLLQILPTPKQTDDQAPYKADAAGIIAEISITKNSEGKDKITETDPGEIYILLDFHKYMKDDYDPTIQRKLRDITNVLKNIRKSVILISPAVIIPADLSKSMAVVDLPLPSAQELEDILCASVDGLLAQQKRIADKIIDQPEKAEKLKQQLSGLQKTQNGLIATAKADKDQLVSAGLGLTAEEYANIIARCLIDRNLSVMEILKEKRAIIKKSGVLEYIDTEENADSIGGLANLKKWMQSTSKCFSKEAQDYGIDLPRGCIFFGSPGTGKSLSAKVLSNVLKLPIIRLDMAAMVGSLYGETANRMKQALKMAHAISPCILWIDELEKAFGTSDGQGMHEETARTFGALLTDMEEATGIFYVGTSNSPGGLKPELLARFPKCFFVDLPTPKERAEIWKIHIESKKVRRQAKDFDMDALVNASAGFSGREIKFIIQQGLRNSFDQLTEIAPGKFKPVEVTTDHFLKELRQNVSIYEQKKDEIELMRNWAKKHATPAGEVPEEGDTPATPATPAGTGKNFDLMDM